MRATDPTAYVVGLRPVNVGAAVGRVLLAALLALTALTGARAAAAAPLRLMVLGDSLTAGYGLPVARSFPVRLEAALRARGRAVAVLNAGVSGDTTAGGLARLDWALAEKPDRVIVALGGNDGLRGLDSEASFRNLDAILAKLAARGIPVLLAGMLAPPNLGREYGAAFNAIYPRLARKHKVPLYPFFLDGVATVPGLTQRDGIHPNARGVDVMVARILPRVLALIDGR